MATDIASFTAGIISTFPLSSGFDIGDQKLIALSSMSSILEVILVNKSGDKSLSGMVSRIRDASSREEIVAELQKLLVATGRVEKW